MRLGVVVPCYRQERFLPRTLAALEQALEGRDWSGVIVLSTPEPEPLAPTGPRWQVLQPPLTGSLTPGGARMLGLAACAGEWVLFPDADVEVAPEWVAAALARAAGTGVGDALAGLGGRLEEWFLEGGRERPGDPDLGRVGRIERPVDHLAGLALYRRDALLRAGGYDARLNSEEDFELGYRLRRLGAELRVLGTPGGRHWSAPRPSFAELERRWGAGLFYGRGQVLRAYLGRPGFGLLLRRQTLFLATLGLWILGLAALLAAASGAGPAFLLAWLLLPLGVLAVMSARKRSPKRALHSLLTWTLNALGLVLGFFRLAPGGPEPATEPGAGTGPGAGRGA